MKLGIADGGYVVEAQARASDEFPFCGSTFVDWKRPGPWRGAPLPIRRPGLPRKTLKAELAVTTL